MLCIDKLSNLYIPIYRSLLSCMASSSRKVAIVSGSNKGIGLAIVRQLCQQFDGDVFLTARNQERGKEAVRALEAEGLSPKFHQLDITSIDSVEKLRKFTADTYGGCDVLVNNAGIAFKYDTTASNIEQATITLETNFTGTMQMLRAFSPIMQPHGRIVNIMSWTGIFSKLSSDALRDKFSSPSLTEEELVALMDQFVADVRDGKQIERGWVKTFYASISVGILALSNVYARVLSNSGQLDNIIVCLFCVQYSRCLFIINYTILFFAFCLR